MVIQYCLTDVDITGVYGNTLLSYRCGHYRGLVMRVWLADVYIAGFCDNAGLSGGCVLLHWSVLMWCCLTDVYITGLYGNTVLPYRCVHYRAVW